MKSLLSLSLRKQRFFTLVAVSLLPFATSGSIISIQDLSTFEGYLQPGSYFEDFSGLAPGHEHLSGLAFSDGSFGFTVYTGDDSVLFRPNDAAPLSPWLSTALNMVDITLDFNSSSVTAFGASFWLTELSGDAVAGDLFVSINGETPITLTSIAGGSEQPFLGFISTDGTLIDTITLSTNIPQTYVTLADTITGAAIPEPRTYAILTGLAALAFVCLRKRKRSGLITKTIG